MAERHVITDPETGEPIGSTCVDGPLSPETAAALQALARAARDLMGELDEPQGQEKTP